MKEYLKMADVFVGEYKPAIRRDSVPAHRYGESSVELYGIQANYAAHAINSHDELVAEVGLLRNHLMACATELGAMIDAHNVQNMDDGSWKYDHQTPWEAMQLLK